MTMTFRTTRNVGLVILILILVAVGLVPTVVISVISGHNTRLSQDMEEMRLSVSLSEQVQEASLLFGQLVRSSHTDFMPVMTRLEEVIKNSRLLREMAASSSVDEGEQEGIGELVNLARLFWLAVHNYHQEMTYDSTGDTAFQFERIALDAQTGMGQRLSSYLSDTHDDIKNRHAEINRQMKRWERISLGGLTLGVICGVLVSLLLGRSLVRPIERLVRGTEKVAHGDLDFRIEVKISDEIGKLGASFNRMTERLHTSMKEEKTVKNELKQANLELERASRMKSEFLANMSHEIRTPMNGVIGMTGLLLDTELTEKQRQYAETVQSSANSLLTVINDILDYSKVEAGKLAIEIIDFDLRTTMEDVADVLAVTAHRKNLELICLVHHEVPALVRGDPGRLRQILTNLANNAVKFTKEGEVVIRAALEEEDERNATVRFSVSDTGIGIPSDRMDRLFRSFSQVDSSTTRKFGGTGLGLAISRQLVEMMGGEIGVESEEGKGSTFWFTAVLEKQSGVREAEMVVPEDIRGKRILVVDDNDTNRRVLREQLRSWGCAVEEAPGGQQALDMLRQALAEASPFDIAILDMRMSGMDGKMLGRKIKEDADLKDMALVMLSSMGQRGDGARMREIGFAAFLTKPVKQSHLYECLTTITGRKVEKESVTDRSFVTRHSIADSRKRKFRILIAEDNTINQQVALNILEKFGYRADAVANGQEVVEAIKTTPYHLVLMDIQMPVMDGFAATSSIRNLKSDIRKIPIIAMTAHAMKGDRERCLAAGMDDYISKPINPDEVEAKLMKWANSIRIDEKDEVNTRDGNGSPGVMGEDSIMDLDSASKRAMGDYEFLKELVLKFVDELPEQIENLAGILKTHDAEKLVEAAHALKGSAANLGAVGIASAALRLEEMGREGNLSAGREALEEISEEVLRLKDYVHGSGRMTVNSIHAVS